MAEYLLCLVLFAVGIYALLAKRNILKMIIGVAIMGYAVNLLMMLVSSAPDTAIPIIERGAERTSMASPLPQALVMTMIISGLCLTVLLVGLAMRLYEKYGTLEISEIRKLKG